MRLLRTSALPFCFKIVVVRLNAFRSLTTAGFTILINETSLCSSVRYGCLHTKVQLPASRYKHYNATSGSRFLSSIIIRDDDVQVQAQIGSCSDNKSRISLITFPSTSLCIQLAVQSVKLAVDAAESRALTAVHKGEWNVLLTD